MVSTDSLTTSLVHPRETFKTAFRESAAAVIFVHDHPSGDTRPSQGEILLTRRRCRPGNSWASRSSTISLPATGGHFSFRDNGLMQRAAT